LIAGGGVRIELVSAFALRCRTYKRRGDPEQSCVEKLNDSLSPLLLFDLSVTGAAID
jgi:hypothetical protein